MTTRAEQRQSERAAIERLDILEDELPAGVCAIRHCEREARYAMAGQWRTFHVCSRHRPLYRRHLHMLRYIRSL